MIDTGELLRFLAAFAVIGGALFGFALLSRSGGRMNGLLRRGGPRIVEIIETTPLPHASSLHVVKVGESYYVIARTEHAISLLSEVSQEVIDAREAKAVPPPSRLLPSRLP